MKIDYREEKIFKNFPDAEIVNLEIGDIIEGTVCIERKSAGDFLSSVKDHRIFNQAINMRTNFEHCAILVESDLDKLSKLIFFGDYKMSMEQVRGAISSLYIKYKVPVLFTSTRKNFVELVNLCITKSTEEFNPLVYTPAMSKKNIGDPKLQVLLQIPGIGPTKAKRILDHYGEFGNINIMERPKGVSDKDLENIKTTLK